MAVPESMTTLDMSGKFKMNKDLSDDTDEILRLQGVGWLTRVAIRNASVYLRIKHYKDDSGVEHIDIDQNLSGGVGASQEYRILDWTERESNNSLFGPVLGRSRRIKIQDLEDVDEFLKKDWTSDVLEHGGVQALAASDTAKSGKTWNTEQIFGFEVIDGNRRYTRHAHFTGPGGEKILTRFVYDYEGPLD